MTPSWRRAPEQDKSFLRRRRRDFFFNNSENFSDQLAYVKRLSFLLQRSLFRLRAKWRRGMSAWSRGGGEECPLGAPPAGRAILFDARQARNVRLELGRQVQQYYLTQGRRRGLSAWSSAAGRAVLFDAGKAADCPLGAQPAGKQYYLA